MNAGDSQILQEAYWQRMDASSANGDAVAEVKASLASVLAVGVALDDAIAAINADRSLSDDTDVGKPAKIGVARDKAQRDLPLAVGSALKKSAARIAATLALMTPKPLALDQAGRAVFITALWEIFRRLDSAQQANVYLTAAQSKDDLTLKAFDLWPTFDPKRAIDDNSIQTGKLLRQEAENADAAAELKELQKLDALLRTAIAGVEAQIGAPDPLMVAAGINKGNDWQSGAGAQ